MTDEYLSEFLSLPAIQRDFLALLASSEPQYGLAIKDQLEMRRQSEISSGRLYSNLDKLAERGLITKGKFTDRRNRYELSDHGHRVLESYRQWLPSDDEPRQTTTTTNPRPIQRITQLDAPGECDE